MPDDPLQIHLRLNLPENSYAKIYTDFAYVPFVPLHSSLDPGSTNISENIVQGRVHESAMPCHLRNHRLPPSDTFEIEIVLLCLHFEQHSQPQQEETNSSIFPTHEILLDDHKHRGLFHLTLICMRICKIKAIACKLDRHAAGMTCSSPCCLLNPDPHFGLLFVSASSWWPEPRRQWCLNSGADF
jgi:hypothetical protein